MKKAKGADSLHLETSRHGSGEQTVTMGLTGDGKPVVIKRFRLVGDRGRREAQWLAAANHPGVVRLVKQTDDPPAIVTDHVPGPTLRTARLKPSDAARVLAAVSNTLADLHRRDLHHGAVNPDHILLTDDRADAAAAILCSPVPTDDPLIDADGLGRCIHWLLADWDDRHLNHADGWARMASGLTSGSPVDLRRVARQLASLAPSPPAQPVVRWPTPLRRPTASWRVMAVAVAAALTLVFTGRFMPDADGPVGGARLHADQQVYAVGQPNDVVIALPQPCPGQPHALLLEQATSTIWVFDSIGDGSTGTPMTVVPGANLLEVEAGPTCPRAWATGPAGRVELDWP